MGRESISDLITSEFFEEKRVTPGSVTPGMSWLAAGVIMGVLLSMAFGWDLFEMFSDGSRTLPPTTEQAVKLQQANHKIASLESELQALRKESGLVARDRNAAERENGRLMSRLLNSGENPELAPVIEDETELIELIEQRDWPRFQLALRGLLRQEAEGFDLILRTARKVIAERPDILGDSKAALSITLALAENDLLVADLIEYGLGSEVFNSDPALVERGLQWASEFFANFFAPGQAVAQKSALAQKLERSLEEGGVHVLVVLECLQVLGMEVPLESLAGRLDRESEEATHGMILTYLGDQDTPRTVEFLVQYIQENSELPAWKLELALEMLARSRHPRAAEGLHSFMESTRPGLRQAAHYAYFSVPRRGEEGLQLLVDFLNDVDPGIGEKRHLLNRTRFHSPGTFQALRESPEKLEDPVLREELKAVLVSTN